MEYGMYLCSHFSLTYFLIADILFHYVVTWVCDYFTLSLLRTV